MKKLLLLVVICSFIACGYAFQGSGSVLPASIKKIFVKDVVNNTTESTVGIILTEALNDRFGRYGTFVVVEKESEADAVVTAKIVNISRDLSLIHI